MLIEPLSIGAFIRLIIASVIFTYISGLHKQFQRLLTENLSVVQAIKLVLATISFFLTVFISDWSFNFLIELWKEASEISDKIAILTVISSFAVSAVIGFTTAYIAYQQYTLAKNNVLQEEIKNNLGKGNQ